MEEIFKTLLLAIMGHIVKEPWRAEILEPIGRSVPDLHEDMLKIAAGPLENVADAAAWRYASRKHVPHRG